MYQPPDHLAYLFFPDYSHLSYEVATRAVMEWRNTELARILYERDGLCWVPDCDGHATSSIHEALLTRGNVVGLRPKVLRLAVHNCVNCVVLCDRHHNTALEPAREEIAAFMADLYGLDVVLDWLASIQFRTRHPMAAWMNSWTAVQEENTR